MVSAVAPYRNSSAKGTPPNLPGEKNSAPVELDFKEHELLHGSKIRADW